MTSLGFVATEPVRIAVTSAAVVPARDVPKAPAAAPKRRPLNMTCIGCALVALAALAAAGGALVATALSDGSTPAPSPPPAYEHGPVINSLMSHPVCRTQYKECAHAADLIKHVVHNNHAETEDKIRNGTLFATPHGDERQIIVFKLHHPNATAAHPDDVVPPGFNQSLLDAFDGPKETLLQTVEGASVHIKQGPNGTLPLVLYNHGGLDRNGPPSSSRRLGFSCMIAAMSGYAVNQQMYG